MKLKIFGLGWHYGHQHELLKIPGTEWSFLRNRIKPVWSTVNRPYPKNLTEVDRYEPGRYDLAVLHIDQQCLFGHPKGIPYQSLNKQITDIPKIVINHGTPHYQDKPPELIRDLMIRAIGANEMVVNSYEAAKEWGFGTVIHHGMDQFEWYDMDKKRRVIMVLSPGTPSSKDDGWSEYYGRDFHEKVRARIEADGYEFVHVGKDVKFEDWESYRRFLGESLVFFNPTTHSPMPRSRTEAMLSGCAVVTTPSHDADMFINGENGRIVTTVDEAVMEIERLLNDIPSALDIGQKGKMTAIDRFNGARFRNEWLNLIDRTLRGYIPDDVKVLRDNLVSLFELAKSNPERFEKDFNGLLDAVIRDHFNIDRKRI